MERPDAIGPAADAAAIGDAPDPTPTADAAATVPAADAGAVGDGSVTAAAAPPVGPEDRRRSADLALARLHLRLGSLALARAELETLAGRDELDEDGLLDLIEARWRTGDLVGAGEAANVVLSGREDGPLIALVVAAEASLGRGRPTEGRRFAERALELAGDSIDAVFAGMPRGGVWPADATATVGPAPTLFDGLAPPRHHAHPGERPAVAASTMPPAAAEATGAPAEGPDLQAEPATLALWGETIIAPADGPGEWTSAAAGVSVTQPDLPTGQDAFRAGHEALDAHRLQDAATQLALAIRLDPTVAPALIDLLGERRERELAFVRGDAYRLVGRERDARRAFADALGPPVTEPHPTDDPPEGDPA